MGVSEYLGKMRALADEMAAGGKSINDEELSGLILHLGQPQSGFQNCRICCSGHHRPGVVHPATILRAMI
jgi:hypothetical protein